MSAKRRKVQPVMSPVATPSSQVEPTATPTASAPVTEEAKPVLAAAKTPSSEQLYCNQALLLKLCDDYSTTVAKVTRATPDVRQQLMQTFLRIIKQMVACKNVLAYADVLKFFQQNINSLNPTVALSYLHKLSQGDARMIARYHTIFTELVTTLQSRGAHKFRFDIKAIAVDTGSEDFANFIASKVTR